VLNMFYYPKKKNKITAVNVLLLLLPQLTHLFFVSNSVVIVDRSTRMFLGAGYPSYATA